MRCMGWVLALSLGCSSKSGGDSAAASGGDGGGESDGGSSDGGSSDGGAGDGGAGDGGSGDGGDDTGEPPPPLGSCIVVEEVEVGGLDSQTEGFDFTPRAALANAAGEWSGTVGWSETESEVATMIVSTEAWNVVAVYFEWEGELPEDGSSDCPPSYSMTVPLQINFGAAGQIAENVNAVLNAPDISTASVFVERPLGMVTGTARPEEIEANSWADTSLHIGGRFDGTWSGELRWVVDDEASEEPEWEPLGIFVLETRAAR